MAKEPQKDAPKVAGGAPQASPTPAGTPAGTPGVPDQTGRTPAQQAAESTPEGRQGRYDPLQSTGAAPVGPGEGSPPNVGRHPPGEAPAVGTSDLGPRRPGFQRDRPFGVFHQRPHAQGGDVTPGTIAGLVRRFNDAARSRDLWECVRLAGLILTDLGESAASFGLGSAPPPEGHHRAAALTRESQTEFDAAARDFDQVKADLVAFAPETHRLDWHRAGGAASGSPAPMGAAPQNAPAINPQNLMAWVQAVAEAIDVFRRLIR